MTCQLHRKTFRKYLTWLRNSVCIPISPSLDLSTFSEAIAEIHTGGDTGLPSSTSSLNNPDWVELKLLAKRICGQSPRNQLQNLVSHLENSLAIAYGCGDCTKRTHRSLRKSFNKIKLFFCVVNTSLQEAELEREIWINLLLCLFQIMAW